MCCLLTFIKINFFKENISGKPACKGYPQTTGDAASKEGVTVTMLKRGSYMSAHVFLNLLNEFGNSDKMRGLSSILSILSLIRNEFNEFNNTRAGM